MAPATTLREAFQATNPQQSLPSRDPYYVDFTQARNSRATDYLKQMIENCGEGQHSPIAFSGHRGSGKSTELRPLEHTLGSSCFPLYMDIVDFLDPLDVDYTDLFLLVCRQVLESLHEHGVSLSANLLHDVEQWFRDVTKETEESVKLSAGISTEAKAGAEIPFIARLLAKLTADAKAGSSRVTTTRQEFDRQFRGLASSTNVLLAAASQALRDANKPHQFLIVFDNLDRLPPERSEALFFAHGSQLQEMLCHAIYTVSIDTYYSRRHLANVFPNHVIIPNIKLRSGKLSTDPYQPGIAALLQVIERRLHVEALLQPPTLAQEFVRRSGGSIRQLIRLLREAVQSAQARGVEALDAEAVEDAARSIQQDYERMLEPGDYELLARTWSTKRLEKSPEYMELLSNLAILEYNGKELWHDVNPLIEPIDAFQDIVRKPRFKRRRR
jgi:hypothetical protein